MTSLIDIMGLPQGEKVDLMNQKYDHWFRWHDSEQTEVDSTGDQNDFTHGYAYLRFVSDDFLAEDRTEAINKPDAGWYIDVRDSAGFVFVFTYYGTGTLAEEAARAAYARFEKAYESWENDRQVEGCSCGQADKGAPGHDQFEHVDYPHHPGHLIDCPACEAKCHCTPDTTECVWSGHDA